MRTLTLLCVLAAGTAAAQTPIQPTGSIQAGEAVAPRAPIGPAHSISTIGLSGERAVAPGGKTSDSGPQPWKDVMGWIGLQRGMSIDEVRALLGTDYRESTNADGRLWTFQDGKALLYGTVQFKGEVLDDWSSPRF